MRSPGVARRAVLLLPLTGMAWLAGCSGSPSGSVPASGGAVASATSGETTSPGTPSPGSSVGADAVPAVGDPGRSVDSAKVPVRLEVSAIGVDVPLIRLGTNADGTLEVPADYQEVGWFSGSAAPGDTGPAIIAGHVDSTDGPAPFFELRELGAGDEVVVTGADGQRRTFTVDGVEQYPKDAFPTAAVYGPAPGPVLRLITCGGSFDRSVGHYRDNVVVFAS